jgi:ribosomal protein S18 acetylase RimI-like enzyme
MKAAVRLRLQTSGSGQACRAILGALPTWFGIEESVENYVAAAERSPSILASLDGEDVGILTLRVHSPYAAEIYVMAVLPEHHRQGVGRAMLECAENVLVDDGVEFLQVKTLSSRHPDEGYRNTRAFYESCGFRTLEEFPELWSAEQPAVQMVKTIVGSDDS